MMVWLDGQEFWYLVGWLGVQDQVIRTGPSPFFWLGEVCFGLNPPCDPYSSPLPAECWSGKYDYINY